MTHYKKVGFLLYKYVLMVRKRSNGFTKSLKNYIVPIIWLALIGLLVYGIFNKSAISEVENDIKYENKIWLNVSLDSDITDSYIIYPQENKKKIDSDISLYKWERIQVKEWSISIDFPSVWDFRLDKNGDIKYDENGDLSLISSDLWVNTKSKLTINMKFVKVLIWENSHLSLSQNEMESNIYLLSWTAEVRNLSWVSSVLWVWQKITISRLNASNEDINLSSYKENIDDFFKTTDWFIKNNWSSYLSANSSDNNQANDTDSKQVSQNKIISFDNLTDESYVSSSDIDVSWTYSNKDIANITLNWVKAVINKDRNIFSFKWIDTSSSENDLVFKVYDDSNDLLSKFLYVVYYKEWTENSVSNSDFSVKSYNVDGSKFTFTSPTTDDTFSTFTSFVTIKWMVLAKWIKKVSVNGYFLKSFNGSSWRYHADMRYNNLKTWTNIYEVKYFDGSWKLVYINYFKIIKKPINTKVSSTYSDEVSVDS